MINTDILSKTNILRLRQGDNDVHKQISNTLFSL